MQIAGIPLRGNLFLAPMAGVTDRPFREICRSMGAAFAVSEMVSANAQLHGSVKTLRRTDHAGESGPVAVQIVGADPAAMAIAARRNVERGAQVIDINMGCPARKVCNVAAGSALMRDEKLVAEILEAVVTAVPEVPVTLKCRTGWDRTRRNVSRIARIAEQAGIRMLAIHGRTRADQYMGEAEYDTIAQVKTLVRIPVVANGDIDSPAKAREVLARTGADGLMIGRAAQGRPWIFREIRAFLETGKILPSPEVSEVRETCRRHLDALYALYGCEAGVRVARKHIASYVRGLPGAQAFRQRMYLLQSVEAQYSALEAYFDDLATCGSRVRYLDNNKATTGEVLAA